MMLRLTQSTSDEALSLSVHALSEALVLAPASYHRLRKDDSRDEIFYPRFLVTLGERGYITP